MAFKHSSSHEYKQSEKSTRRARRGYQDAFLIRFDANFEEAQALELLENALDFATRETQKALYENIDKYSNYGPSAPASNNKKFHCSRNFHAAPGNDAAYAEIITDTEPLLWNAKSLDPFRKTTGAARAPVFLSVWKNERVEVKNGFNMFSRANNLIPTSRIDDDFYDDDTNDVWLDFFDEIGLIEGKEEDEMWQTQRRTDKKSRDVLFWVRSPTSYSLIPTKKTKNLLYKFFSDFMNENDKRDEE